VISCIVGRPVEIRWNDGRTESIPASPFDPLVENYLEYFRYLRDESPRPATTLADSRPFVVLNDLAYLSSGQISPIPGTLVSGVREEKEQQDYIQVAGLSPAQDAFLAKGTWPGATGWNRPPGDVATPADLPRLREVVRSMAAK
jgi:hypothetical protein